jgi:hypothetical protein
MKWVLEMSNRIVPTDKRGRILFFFSLCFAGYLYFARIVLTGFFVGTSGTLLRIFFWLSPILCVGALALHVVFLGVYVFRGHGQFSPVLFLVGGLLAARFLPIPPTPEEISFSWQNAEYNQIVELARSNQLQQGNDCFAQDQFLPPSNFFQWSGECIRVNQEDGLIVEFAPRSLERPIVFFENATNKKSPPCWSDSEPTDVFKQLSEHWYICERWLVNEQ